MKSKAAACAQYALGNNAVAVSGAHNTLINIFLLSSDIRSVINFYVIYFPEPDINNESMYLGYVRQFVRAIPISRKKNIEV